MKKLFLTLIGMMAMFASSHAQTKWVGDMNDDGKLNISDVTVLVNTLLGKVSAKEISGDGLDQTALIGEWVASDGSWMTFYSGGKGSTSDDSAASTYGYNPSNKSLVFYNSSNVLESAYTVHSVSSTTLVVSSAGSATQKTYRPKSSWATSIKISASTTKVFVDKALQLNIVVGTRLYSYDIESWKSSDESIARVSSDGLVTGVSSGTVTITATDAKGHTATCSLTVIKPVTSVTFSNTSLTVPVGATITIPMIVEPYDASTQSLNWSSSKTSVATISNGVLSTLAAGTATITAKTTDGTNLQSSCTVKVINATTPTGLTVSKPSGASTTIAPGGYLLLSANISPSTASSLSVLWSSSNERIATVDKNGRVTATTNLPALTKGNKATITARVAGTSLKYSIAVYVDDSSLYVDLGLPSGTLWATMNVGASAPEEYGNYYAWGETKAYGEVDKSNTVNYNYCKSYIKKTNDWPTYKWCHGDENTLTKYNTDSYYGTVDDKRTLDLEDDAAYVNWCDKWRMPTKEEIEELFNYCMPAYNGMDTKHFSFSSKNGIYGLYFRSKKDSSKYIFLPAAGCYIDDDLYNLYNKECNYWTSTLCSGTPRTSYYININSRTLYSDSDCKSITNRCYALPIRPVRR